MFDDFDSAVPIWLASLLCTAYEFNKFITLHFQPDLSFEDDATAAGKIVADTIQALVEYQGIEGFWWGRVDGEPDLVRIIVGACAFAQMIRNLGLT